MFKIGDKVKLNSNLGNSKKGDIIIIYEIEPTPIGDGSQYINWKDSGYSGGPNWHSIHFALVKDNLFGLDKELDDLQTMGYRCE